MCRLKKSSLATLLLFFLTAVFSCSIQEEEGRWAPMKWTSDRPGDPRKITAPDEGGTYKLVCINYGGPWISNVTTADTTIYSGSKDQDFRHIKYDWYDVSVKENTFNITLQPNATGKERKLSIVVTAGDIFDYIEIIQGK